jgi:4-carboxymuconolactone decarboxylase
MPPSSARLPANRDTRTVRFRTRALSEQHAAMAMIGAFTGTGDLRRVKTALNTGLDAGVTVNQVKELPVQMYASARS